MLIFFIFFENFQWVKNMPKHGFSLAYIFPYKDKIVGSVLTRGKYGSEKTYFLEYFTPCSALYLVCFCRLFSSKYSLLLFIFMSNWKIKENLA